MHTALVTKFGQPPAYTSIPKPEPPPASSDLVQIKVLYAGVHQIVRSRASGQHYSVNKHSSAGQPIHLVPGIDGVGTISTGEHVYFINFGPAGAMSEYLNVPKAMVRTLPEGVDSLQAAAFVNPVLSSWMALKFRTNDLPRDGWTALIMGVTSSSGIAAIAVAKALGAKKVVGVARNVKKMEELGLDVAIKLEEDATKTDFAAAGQVDVVLDYVYGEHAVEFLKQVKTDAAPLQYVHVGALSGQPEINLPGAVLRSKDVTIRGAGPGAWQMKKIGGELEGMLNVLKGFSQHVDAVPLEDVETAWNRTGGERLVFKM